MVQVRRVVGDTAKFRSMSKHWACGPELALVDRFGLHLGRMAKTEIGQKKNWPNKSTTQGLGFRVQGFGENGIWEKWVWEFVDILESQ